MELNALVKMDITNIFLKLYVGLVMNNGKNFDYILFSKTCNNGAETNCLSCESSYHRSYDNIEHTCLCEDGYYDSGNLLCDRCHYSWLLFIYSKIFFLSETCDNGDTSTNCKTCSNLNHRTYDSNDNTCLCDNLYYNEADNPICQPCHYSWFISSFT